MLSLVEAYLEVDKVEFGGINGQHTMLDELSGQHISGQLYTQYIKMKLDITIRE